MLSTIHNNSQLKAKLTSYWKKCLKEYGDKNVSSKRSRPTMVLSIIGDSDTFVPKPWPKNVFQTALMEAAKSGEETWILYRGGDESVSNVVKEGYKQYETIEFGIETKTNTDPLRHIKLISTLKKKIEKPSTKAKQNLEEDDPDYLLEFEKFVSEQKIHYFGTNVNYEMSVPIAIIVCEGDIQTISHISNAVRRQLPVIIMKGSGKAADLVVDYLDNCSQHVLRKKSSLLFGIKFDETQYTKIKEHLELIEQNRELVGIFDLDRDDPLMLSNIVGEAVISCWSMKNIVQTDIRDSKKRKKTETADPVDQTMNQNLNGNSIGGAPLLDNSIQSSQLLKGLKSKTRPFVLHPELSTSTSLPLYFFLGYQILQEDKDLMESCGNAFLLEAMKANRCDYVRVLMDQGVKIKHENLNALFAEQPYKIKEKSPGSAKKNCRTELRYKEFDVDGKTEDDIISDLLLWAILEKRNELAELFWLRGTDHLLSGLVCSAFLKKLSKKATKDEDLLEAKAREELSICFEQRCIRLMDKMYEENQEQTIKILHTKASVWGISSSPLTFAYENLMYDVVAHASCRKYMKLKFDDNLTGDKTFSAKCFRCLCAPRTRYIIHFVIFSFVLLMYSGFVLTSIDAEYSFLHPRRIPEYLVFIWAFGDLLEEIISLSGCLDSETCSHLDRYSRVLRYVDDFWNVMDMLSYILLIAALHVRYIDPVEMGTNTIARNMFALSLLCLYLRFLGVFLIRKTTGVLIIMIINMLKDLVQFILIAIFVIFGVGIYYHANLYPDHRSMWNGNLSRWRVWTIIFHPYWELYGELDLDTLDGSDQRDCTKNSTVWGIDANIKRCPEEDWTVPVIAGLHMLVANLLLVNLVIAKFSNTFQSVQAESEKWWYYHLYTVVTDYAVRIPSPLNLILRPIHLTMYLLKLDHSCKKKIANSTHNSTTDDNIKAYQRSFQKIIALRNDKIS